VGVVAAAFAIGVTLAYGYHVLADGSTSGGASGAAVRDQATPSMGALPAGRLESGAAVVDPTPAPDPPGPAAPSPRDAVTQFLDAEVAQDFASSYAILGALDRSRAGSRAQWIADHGDIAPIVAFRPSGVSVDGARAEVSVDLALRPSLDQVHGLVTAHAAGSYVAVLEDGGWRVAFTDSRLTPIYPPDALATEAVRRWVQDRQACRKPVEYEGGLLGAASRASMLCHARGAIQVGAPSALPETDADEPFLAAFGPSVYEWARVVRVRAPSHLDVVVAPMGEHWLVIGVLQGSAGSS
jgi:hypothetical protein